MSASSISSVWNATPASAIAARNSPSQDRSRWATWKWQSCSRSMPCFATAAAGRGSPVSPARRLASPRRRRPGESHQVRPSARWTLHEETAMTGEGPLLTDVPPTGQARRPNLAAIAPGRNRRRSAPLQRTPVRSGRPSAKKRAPSLRRSERRIGDGLRKVPALSTETITRSVAAVGAPAIELTVVVPPSMNRRTCRCWSSASTRC